MNYIKRLEAEFAKVQATKDNIDSFLAHLHSAKFTGVDTDGGRKDWIAKTDMINWLRDVRSELS